ncbi:amino acid transporter [Trypanosoma grayi]|uniref:amino acid transporter n=1 Tax=Trypanosoma grayi TaxID=71804 RepID=UPI0004F40DE0|nr:amino acid transporter [Trypanosoma grayi]KEG08381.1 amino acid transporter [Trypanosoma grayi]
MGLLSPSDNNKPATAANDDRARTSGVEPISEVLAVNSATNLYPSDGDTDMQLSGETPPESAMGEEEDDDIGSVKTAGAIRENTNIWKSAFHIFKANVGTGVFLLPTFYKDAGYVMGAILGAAIGACVVDASRLLLHTKLRINRPRVDTYSRICGYVLGRPMQWALFLALILTQFGFCLMYVQLTAGTMNEMVSFTGSEFIWMLAVFVIVYPLTCFSDNLSLLALASILAAVAVTFALVATLARSGVVIHTNHGISPFTNLVGTNLPIGWFNNLANNMMVLEGIAIVLPVHSACNQKQHFLLMLCLVLAIVVAFYLLYGLVGYLAYGSTITTSLVSSMPEDTLSIVIRVTFIINLVCTYPVQFQSAIQLIDQLASTRSRSWKGLLIRLVINAIITGLAMGIGSSTVDIVVSFIGALPATVMVLILPALLNLQLEYAVENPDEDRGTLAYWKKIFTQRPVCSWLRFRCYLYIVLGVLIMGIGTYSIAITL